MTSMSAAHNIAASSFSKLFSGGSQHITSTDHGVTPTLPHQPEAFIQILQRLDSSNVNPSATRYLHFNSSAYILLIHTTYLNCRIYVIHYIDPNCSFYNKDISQQRRLMCQALYHKKLSTINHINHIIYHNICNQRREKNIWLKSENGL